MKYLPLSFSFSFSLLILLPPAMYSAGISIHVEDPQQHPVARADVSLTSRNSERRTLTTDTSGSCVFEGIPKGDYLVEVSATGFDTSAAQAVHVQDRNYPAITIPLGIARVRTSVVVTASGTPQEIDEVSKSVTVVDSAAMELRSDKTIGSALRDVPGVRMQQLGGPGSTTYLKVRGLRNSDTAVLVDGLRLRDAAGTQADASGVLQDLVLADTERIEVLRGAGSSLYGTNATGGVVNIITAPGGGRTRGSVSVDGGALGSVRGIARLAGGLHHDRIEYSLGVTHWNVTRGIEDNSPARNTSEQGLMTWHISPIASLSGRIYAGRSFSFIRLSPRSVGTLPAVGIVDAVPLSLDEQHRYESGTPVARLNLNSATFIPASSNPDSSRHGSFFTGAVRLNVQPSARLGLTAQYQHVRTTRDYADGPAGPGFQPSGNDYSTYKGDIGTANARMDLFVGLHHFDAGYEFERENFENKLRPPTPMQGFLADINQRSHAIYAQDQLRLIGGRLQLAAGYRAQFFSLTNPRFSPLDGSPFAGRSFLPPPTAQTGDLSAAYMFRETGTRLRVHAGRGYRAPSLYERFGTYFSGASLTLYGDPLLRPDRSASIDAGIDQNLWNSRVRLSASYFYTRLNEVVVFDTTGAVNPTTDPLGRYGGYRNTRGGIARGAEFSVNAALTKSLQLSGAYIYTDARQSTPLVAGVWRTYETPEHQYSVFATERFTSRWTAYAGYVGASDFLSSISGRAFRLEGVSRVQAGVSYRRPLSEFRAIRFYANGDNLANQTYFDSGFRTPGATLTGGMQFEF